MKSHLLECVAMQNYEVEVKNHSEVTEVQELFFAMGCRKGVCVDSRYPKLIVTHNNNDGWYSAGAMIGHNNKYKKITLQELRDMVTLKQKEYLVKTDTGYTLQVLSDVVDGHDGIIEVPEGAVALVTYDKNAGYWFNKENKFKGFGRVSNIGDFGKIDTLDNDSYLDYSNAIGGCVTWQRKESLNDQVASAEKARQEQAQCKLQTVETNESDLVNAGQKILDGFTQPEELPFVDDEPKLRNIKIRVNGNFDKAVETIQSMGYWNFNIYSIPRNCYWLLGNENATVDYGSKEYLRDDGDYVEYFIEDEPKKIDATLNEHQSQYGDFKDIAGMTQQLLTVMGQYGYEYLPDTHKEALHMICSKMARIVNGDHNHLDSWHDIGGYAKLIENNIK